MSLTTEFEADFESDFEFWGAAPAAQAAIAAPAIVEREVQLTFGQYLRTWWLVHWRTAAGSVAIALFVFDAGVMQLDNTRQVIITLMLLWLPITWTFLVTGMLLQKNFHGFRLALMDDAGEVPATVGRVLRIWWSYTWRNTAMVLLLSLPQLDAIAAAGHYTNHGSAWRVLDFFWTFIVMFMVLRKQYRGFRIAMFAPEKISDRISD